MAILLVYQRVTAKAPGLFDGWKTAHVPIG